MNVLSLFDGISCAYVSFQRAGIQVRKYYASEIDKNAITISKRHVPCRIDVGDVRTITALDETIDVLVGGSPCQDLSIAKKGRRGLDGDRSGLFWEYVRIRDFVKPKWFILENVASMLKADKDIITQALGVEPIMINASLVSAQCRKRLFWTNIPNVTLPEDRGIFLKDILQPDSEVDESMTVHGKSFCLTASYAHTGETDKEVQHNRERSQRTMVFTHVAVGRDNLVVGPRIRKLTPMECERLQGLPDNYTEGIAKTNRYRCLGNAFNVDVMTHIISFIHNGADIQAEV